MSFNLNHVLLAGHLTRDPQVKALANDRSVAEFGLAINRKYKDANGTMQEDATFIDVEAWGRTAELVGQYLTKGSACYIEGRLKFESWQDKDGGKRSKLKVVADNVQFIGSRPRGDGANQAGDDAHAQPTMSVAGPTTAASGDSVSSSNQAQAARGRGARSTSRTVPANAQVESGDEPPF